MGKPGGRIVTARRNFCFRFCRNFRSSVRAREADRRPQSLRAKARTTGEQNNQRSYFRERDARRGGRRSGRRDGRKGLSRSGNASAQERPCPKSGWGCIPFRQGAVTPRRSQRGTPGKGMARAGEGRGGSGPATKTHKTAPDYSLFFVFCRKNSVFFVQKEVFSCHFLEKW